VLNMLHETVTTVSCYLWRTYASSLACITMIDQRIHQPGELFMARRIRAYATVREHMQAREPRRWMTWAKSDRT
jgi:hypothetical protein